MHELSNTLMVLWTLGTFIFSAGFGWAGIRLGQKQLSSTVDELRRDVKAVTCRLHKDEQEYMRVTMCRQEQVDCREAMAYHENGLMTKLDDLKEYFKQMDDKRENTKKDLSEKLSVISGELNILKSMVTKA